MIVCFGILRWDSVGYETILVWFRKFLIIEEKHTLDVVWGGWEQCFKLNSS